LDRSTYSIEAWWKKIDSNAIKGYRIYSRGKKVAEFSAKESPHFFRCLPNKRSAGDFEIVAVSKDGLESEPLKIRVKHD